MATLGATTAAALAASAALAALPVPHGAYRGATVRHGRVALEVRAHRVVAVAATVAPYRCATFGELGPVRVRVRVRPGARIGAGGRVSLAAGPAAQRLALRARFRRGGRVRGTLRLRGTIATGDPCRSPLLAFHARR